MEAKCTARTIWKFISWQNQNKDNFQYTWKYLGNTEESFFL